MLALAASLGIAQSQDVAQPKFEVASIKRDTNGQSRVNIGGSPDRFQAQNVWLRFLIQWAWNVKDFQISGGPGWAGSDRYDINATKGATAGLEQTRLMLQSLLEDRFQLKLHRESKESQVYALMPAKSGMKLRPSSEGSCIPRSQAAGQATDPKKLCGHVEWSRRSVEGTSISMEELITTLSQILQRPVLDKTGFTSRFDAHAEWTADQSTPGLVAPGLPPDAASTDPNGKSIFTALQEQLGLRLESTKGPVEFLVIDHLERPSEN